MQESADPSAHSTSPTPTVMDHSLSEDSHAHLSPQLLREIERDDYEFSQYGGDDPHEPPSQRATSTVVPTPTHSSDDLLKVQWDGPEDPENPRNWSRSRKWVITLLCALITLNVTFASSSPSSGIEGIQKTFGVSAEVSELVTSTFLLGYVFGPLFWAPGSELLGRRPVFIGSLAVYILFHLGQALAPNIQTLLVTRFLAGFFGSAPLTNSGGVIADIWDPAGISAAVSLFTASVFVGPVLGPIVGGFVSTSYLGWRWIFWIMMIFAGATWLLMVFVLPETYTPVLLQNKAKRLRTLEPEKNNAIYAEHERQDWSFRGILQRTLFRPFIMLGTEPILVLVTIYLSIIYGLLYALFEAFPIIFIIKRGFTPGQDGLIFIGVGLGTSIGCIVNWYFSRDYGVLMQEWRGHPPPEKRLKGAMLAGPFLVIGILWLGWTGQYESIPWYVPALSTLLVGMSFSLVFISFLTYLVDTYIMYSASALAANTICRSALAAAFPLFTVQMFNKLGVNYACTLIAAVGVVLAPSPFLFYKYGPRIRAGSKFAPCIDLKIAAELNAEKQAQVDHV